MMIFLSLVDEFLQRGCLQRTLASLTTVTLSLIQEEIEGALPNLLPLLHNTKYSKAALRIVEGLLSAHTEAAEWKGEVLRQVECELGSIESLLELAGMLELVEHNF
jgi:hypothetical protein